MPFVVPGRGRRRSTRRCDWANDTEYGLTAGLFSHDPAEIETFLDTHRGRRRVREPPRGRHHRRLAGRAAVRGLEGQRVLRQVVGRAVLRPAVPARAEPHHRPLSFGPSRSLVFHRVVGPRPARGGARVGIARLWDTEGRRYLDGSGGAVVVNIGHGREEVAAAMAAPGRGRRLRARHAVHERRARGVRAPPGRPRARRLPPPLPRLRRLGGERDRGQARARLSPRARTSRPAQGDRPLRLLPRQHAGHALALRPPDPAGALRAAAAARARSAAAPVLLPLPARPRAIPTASVACADDLEAVIAREGRGDDRRLRRRADPGRLRGRGRAARGLRPARARDLPPPRRSSTSTTRS